eukprot:1191464-Prorocentrum_minimum.AAC.2
MGAARSHQRRVALDRPREHKRPVGADAVVRDVEVHDVLVLVQRHAQRGGALVLQPVPLQVELADAKVLRQA